MKKVIIVVVAIASLLSFNFASGREIASVTDIFQPVWEAINGLQNQITSLAERVTNVEHNPPNSKLVTMWQGSNTVQEMNNSQFIDVTGYVYARLLLSWSGNQTHPCQYAYRYSNDGSVIIYDSTYNGSSCNTNVDIPLSGARYLQIGAYTPPNGTLNGSLYLYNTPQGPIGPQGPEGVMGPGLKVYDTNGQEVGLLIETRGTEIRVWDTVLNKIVVGDAVGTSLTPEGVTSRELGYSEPNCQGEIYAWFGNQTKPWEVIKIPSGNPQGWGEYAQINNWSDIKWGVVTVQSLWSPDAPTYGCRNNVHDMTNAARIYEAQSRSYSGPFTIRAE